MGEVIIPPWVRPESPESIRWIDDATSAFAPAFGRGMTQRGIWADPRWGLRRRYRGLRSDEKAAILNALSETRGQLNILRVTPHAPIRGSFPTSELLTNNTFASGTTGYSASTGASLSVSDRLLRVTVSANAGGYAIGPSAAATVVQYAPLALRAFAQAGRGAFSSVGLRLGSSALGVQYGESIYTNSSLGMISATFTPPGTSAYFGFSNYETGLGAGDFFRTPYLSMARCALVDNGPDDLNGYASFDIAAWTKTSGDSISADGASNYVGQSVADIFVEGAANSDHNLSQAGTVAAAAHDRIVWCTIKANGRNFAYLQMTHAGGSVNQFFNVTSGAGAVGASGATGVGWANRRAFVVDLGGGWYHCAMIANKSGAQTSVTNWIGAASADGTASYVGASGNALNLYGGGAAASTVPTRVGISSSLNPTGTVQTGSALHTKGWPASTSGLLLTGDWFEINGELKQLTAPVNSDAAGLAYIHFRPGLASSPADNDPIIVHEPFGRFIYPQGTREMENLFGIYGDCEMNLEEVYS